MNGFTLVELLIAMTLTAVIGMVLFFLTLAFNLIADYVSHKFRQTGSATL